MSAKTAWWALMDKQDAGRRREECAEKKGPWGKEKGNVTPGQTEVQHTMNAKLESLAVHFIPLE